MNEKQHHIWAAGIIEGCGVIACNMVQGPTRMYPAIDLIVAPLNSNQIERLTIAANNGSVHKEPSGFVLGGYAAIKGFLGDMWPYFTSYKRREINAELRRYKLLLSEQT